MFKFNKPFGIAATAIAIVLYTNNTSTTPVSLPPDSLSPSSSCPPSSSSTPRKLTKDRSLKLHNKMALSSEERERLLKGYLPADNDEEHMRNAFTHEIHCDSMIEH